MWAVRGEAKGDRLGAGGGAQGAVEGNQTWRWQGREDGGVDSGGIGDRGGRVVSGAGIWLDSGVHRLPLVAIRGTGCGGSSGRWKARKGSVVLVCVGDDFF